VIHSSTGDKVVSDTKLKPFAFVVMPFAKEFDDVYRFGIKSACIDAGAYCERVDEQIFHEDILDRVYNQLSSFTVWGRPCFYAFQLKRGNDIDQLCLVKNELGARKNRV
jgi:hypothetical protein